jgi:hypothetical protein
MSTKQILMVLLLAVSLPVTVPLTLIIFWGRCALNASEKMMSVLDDEETEPVAMVESLDDIGKQFEKKYPMSTPQDPNCDYIDR